MTIPGEMLFFCDKGFDACCGYEVDKFEALAKIMDVVEEAMSDEEIMDYFKENSLFHAI